MASFHEFLSERFAAGGFSTDDALASFLPLARQVAQSHAANRVAPLDGVSALQVEAGVLWYPEASAVAVTTNAARVRTLDVAPRAVEIVSMQKHETDSDT